jgi:hypothetical protein
MEKLLRILQKGLPFFVLYPKWFQILCIIVIVQAFALVLIGLILYPQVSTKREALDKSKEISLSVDVLRPGNVGNDLAVSYDLERVDSGINITARLPYLGKVEQGGPIESFAYTWEPFSWEYPALDVKILNNGTKSVYFTEAVFLVAESEPNLEPIPVIAADQWGSNARHILLCNEGWGPMKNVRLSYNLLAAQPADRQGDSSQTFSDTSEVGDVIDAVNVDLSSALEKAGAKLQEIDAMKVLGGRLDGNTWKVTVSIGGKTLELDEAEFESKRAALFGPFEGGEAIVSGILEYSASGADTEAVHKVKFSTTVFLFNENRVGAPGPPTHEYGVFFDSSRRNYSRRISISQILKPGDSDRFTFRVGCEKSSHHTFRLQLIYNSNETIESPAVDLRMLVPTSGHEYARRKDN